MEAANDEGDTAEWRAEAVRLGGIVVHVNDALFGLAGIFGRVLVDTGLVDRAELALSIERRAAAPDDPDHNPLLLAFARAVRMNFPGGSFDVIEGGKPSEVDPV